MNKYKQLSIIGLLLLVVLTTTTHAATPVVTGTSDRLDSMRSFINLTPTVLAGQCLDPTKDTYGSFQLCEDVTGSTDWNARYQEISGGLAYSCTSDPTNTYVGNPAVCAASVLGVDNLYRGYDFTGTFEWPENGVWKQGTDGRVPTFFTGKEVMRVLELMGNYTQDLSWEYNNDAAPYALRILAINFDNGTAQDMSGNNRFTQNVNTIINSSVAHSGLGGRFNGVDTWINLSDNFDMTSGSNWTFCAWIYTGSTGSIKYINSKYPAGAPAFEFTKEADDRIKFYTRNSSVTLSVTGTTVINTSTWYHTCYTVSGSDMNQTVYLNGVAENSTLGARGGLSNAANFLIGARSTVASHWNGRMDDVVLYTKALNSTEILKLYQNKQFINYTTSGTNSTAELYLNSVGTLNYSTVDIDQNGKLDGFWNITISLNDTSTNTIDIYSSNATANASYYLGSILRNNSNLSINFSINISNDGALNNYSWPIETQNRTGPLRQVLELQFKTSTTNVGITNIKAEFNRKSEWDRMMRLVCNHIYEDYSNISYEVPVCNQWLGGADTLFRCAEYFSNTTMNESAKFMLNMTLFGNNDTTGEVDGVCKESHGDSGNYGALQAYFYTDLCTRFPFTCAVVNEPARRYWNMTTYKMFGYNFSLKETSYGTRTAANTSPLEGSAARFYPNTSVVPQRILQLANNNTRVRNLSTYLGVTHYFTMDATSYIDEYRWWYDYSSGATPLPQENDSAEYFVNWSGAEIGTIKTQNYTCWFEFGHDYPRSQLSDCYDLSGLHFLSGKQGTANVNTLNISTGEYVNAYETAGIMTVHSTTYPVNITLSGRMKNSLGATKTDNNDGSTIAEGSTPANYAVLHEDTPNGRVLKTVNLTSNTSTINSVSAWAYGWCNYACSLKMQINGNNSCNISLSFDNTWGKDSEAFATGCLRNGLNNITTTSFTAGEQIRLAYNATYDLNQSYGSKNAGVTWNESNINPRTNTTQNGEFLIRLVYDTTDVSTNFTQNIVFYNDGILITATAAQQSNFTLNTLSREAIGGGTLLASTPVQHNNLTVIVNGKNASYNDTTIASQLGNQDYYRVQGTSAQFFLGFITNNSEHYLTDATGRRLSLPVTIANTTSNVRTINSNLPFTISTTTLNMLTGGVNPTSPRISYSNGTSQTPLYSYNVGATLLSANASIPEGTSTLVFLSGLSMNLSVSSLTNSTALITGNMSSSSNMTICYGNTTNLGTCTSNSTAASSIIVLLQNLSANTTYYYNATAFNGTITNTTGPWNFTTNATININVTLPNITSIVLSTSTPILSQHVTINVTAVNGTYNISYVRINISRSLSIVATSNATSLGNNLYQYEFNDTTTPGLYSVNVTVFDTSNNQVSQTTSFLIAPNVTLNSPSNASVDTDGTVLFNWTVSSALSITSCSIYGQNSLYTTVSASNGTNTLLVSGISGGHSLGGAPLTWYVTCLDSNGGVGTSDTYYVTSIVQSSGGGGGGGGGGSTNTTNTTNTTGGGGSSTNTTSNNTGANTVSEIAIVNYNITNFPKNLLLTRGEIYNLSVSITNTGNAPLLISILVNQKNTSPDLKTAIMTAQSIVIPPNTSLSSNTKQFNALTIYSGNVTAGTYALTLDITINGVSTQKTMTVKVIDRKKKIVPGIVLFWEENMITIGIILLTILLTMTIYFMSQNAKYKNRRAGT